MAGRDSNVSCWQPNQSVLSCWYFPKFFFVAACSWLGKDLLLMYSTYWCDEAHYKRMKVRITEWEEHSLIPFFLPSVLKDTDKIQVNPEGVMWHQSVQMDSIHVLQYKKKCFLASRWTFKCHCRAHVFKGYHRL